MPPEPINRQVTLAARPVGEPAESDFALVEGAMPEPAEGEALVRTLWLSLDPYQRGRMSEARSYAPPVEPGQVMPAQVVGEVVECRSSKFRPGDVVLGPLGWQEFAVASARALRGVDPSVAPISTALHVLGMTGLTAYFGLFEVAQPLPGETVVVSAASGAVGQIVGQLAQLAGCRTVGIAGSPEKVDDLLTLYRYDAAIDYKREDVGQALKRECPDGIDVYFDNVGGAVSDAVYRRLALGARIAVCGLISQYNQQQAEGPHDLRFLIVCRARMQGFLVTDFAHRYEEALRRLAAWVGEGRLRYREDVVEGLERAPQAFIGLFRGENRGKLLVKVGEPSVG
jgi:NADPH-dependent curcumin reductase CurA